MNGPKFSIGDEVFVHDPFRYVADARCLAGVIDKIVSMGSSFKYEFQTEKISVRTGPGTFDFKWVKPRRVSIHEIDLRHSMGTPMSELDGRDGGNEAWRRISESWGY